MEYWLKNIMKYSLASGRGGMRKKTNSENMQKNILEIGFETEATPPERLEIYRIF